MAAPTAVIRGQTITQAQMNQLAAFAQSKLQQPFRFPVPVIRQVPDEEERLKFHLADWGVSPGGIVIQVDTRKVYQLMPLKVVESGTGARRSWEIHENWEERFNWHLLDRPSDWITHIPPYTNALLSLSAAVGDYAAFLNGPEIWECIAAPSNVLTSWRFIGGETPNVAINPVDGIDFDTTPIWRTILRAMQSAALARVSDAGRRPYRHILYQSRRIPVFNIDSRLENGGPTPLRRELGLPSSETEHVLWVNRLGAVLPNLPQTTASSAAMFRMFQEVSYFARSESEVIVAVRVAGRVNWKAGGVLGGEGVAGVRFDFRRINEVGVNYVPVSHVVDFTFAANRVLNWSDNTGVGEPSQTVLGSTSFYSTRGANYPLFSPPQTFKQWAGGIMDIYANCDGQTSVEYFIDWRMRCTIAGTTANTHSSAVIRQGRLPDVAVEVPGFTTPAGNTLEIGRVAFVPSTGDLHGCYLAKPACTIPIFYSTFTGTSNLKYDVFLPPPDSHWAIEPYPVYEWTGTPLANPTKWASGVDGAGNAVTYDIFATRVSSNPPQLTYPATPLRVDIGNVRNGTFTPFTFVNIPASQAGARITGQFVLMDNEPLYYRSSGQVSVVQVMAIPRRKIGVALNAFLDVEAGNTTFPSINRPGAPVANPFDFEGAQFGFADDYNATVDLLNSLP